MPDKQITETRTYTLTRRRKVKVADDKWVWQGEPAVYTATCTINIDRIMHTLADKAAHSKSGTSRGMHGAIVVKVKPQ